MLNNNAKHLLEDFHGKKRAGGQVENEHALPASRNLLNEQLRFERLDAAYTDSTTSPRRGAFIFSEPEAGAAAARPPCHISFLWSQSNEALVGLLSPLLPVAKALGLFLLDFDVYRETRDSEATAAQVVPAVRRFFLESSAAASPRS